MNAKMRVSMAYKGPKSMCMCGHAGDGEGVAEKGNDHRVSLHAGLVGHGACMARGCKCIQFTWKASLPAYKLALDAA